MTTPLSSLSLLGLDPSSFRLVHDDEMAEEPAGNMFRHSDGSACACLAECRECVPDPAEHLVAATA